MTSLIENSMLNVHSMFTRTFDKYSMFNAVHNYSMLNAVHKYSMLNVI